MEGFPFLGQSPYEIWPLSAPSRASLKFTTHLPGGPIPVIPSPSRDPPQSQNHLAFTLPGSPATLTTSFLGCNWASLQPLHQYPPPSPRPTKMSPGDISITKSNDGFQSASYEAPSPCGICSSPPLALLTIISSLSLFHSSPFSAHPTSVL